MGNQTNLGIVNIQISWKIDQWFPEIEPAKLAQLKQLHDLLLKFNKTINLISTKAIPTADSAHFADSILGCQLIHNHKKPAEIYDFGSGNGFPGLVYAILYPQTKLKLVELDLRKAEYLKQAAAALKLSNVEVLIQSVESLPEKSISFAMARGFAVISKAILIGRKHFGRGGIYYHMKGEEWATEVAQIPTQLCSFWLPGLVGEYKLPVGAAVHAVVFTEKIGD